MTKRKKHKPDYSNGEWAFSRRLRYRIRCHPVPAYALAHAYGIKPSAFYKYCRCVTPVSRDDDRLRKMCEFLGLKWPDECLTPFDKVGE